MNKKLNVTLFCVSFRFSNIEFKKPPFQIMKAIHDVYGVTSNIVFDEELYPLYYKENNLKISESVDGVNLINLSDGDRKLPVLKRYLQYIENNADNIDVMILFHCTKYGAIISNYYKKKNPRGKVIDVMDNRFNTNKESILIRFLKTIKHNVFNRNIIQFIKKTCDEFLICTKKEYDYLKNNKFFSKDISSRISHVPYGIQFSNNENTVTDKKKKFITVGRIGTSEKNTSLILKAIDGLDLKDWEFDFIGPVEDSFNMEIKEFFEKNENLKDKVKFIGAVEDRELLKQYYSESSVFVLSSKYESFGLVLVEALSFGNYLLSTDVGVASELIDNNNCGKIFCTADELKDYMIKIINNVIDISEACECASKVRSDYSWNNIVGNIKSLEAIL